MVNIYLSHLNAIQLRKFALEKKWSLEDHYIFYVDLMNNLTTFYMPEVMKNVLEFSKVYKSPVFLFDTILKQILELKLHFPNSKIVFFYESGESTYHKNINSNYKRTRKRGKLLLEPEEIKDFFSVLKDFKEIFETLVNSIEGVYVLHLKYMESDFIPFRYYHKNLLGAKDSHNIILSADKDMFQLFRFDQFKLQVRNIPRVERKEVERQHTLDVLTASKKETNLSEEELLIINRLIPHALAVSGDSSDDIKGVKGIGYKTFYKKIFKESEKILEVIDESDEEIFDTVAEILNLGADKERIFKNLKLTSFEIINNELPYYIQDQLERLEHNLLTDKEKLTVEEFLESSREILGAEIHRNLIEGYENSKNYLNYLNNSKETQITRNQTIQIKKHETLDELISDIL